VDEVELPHELAERVDAWLARTLESYDSLDFSDLRKGVRSLSSLYVERRGSGDIAIRSISSPAKRAAFATYYAGLHFLTAWHATRVLELGACKRIVDLGCGTGAAGAGAAIGCGAREMLGVDRSGWALGETRRTWAAFGLRGRTLRASLPARAPRLGEGDRVVLGWALNELAPEGRLALVEALLRGARAGADVLVLEPLAGFVSPWWAPLSREVESAGVRETQVKARVKLPEWIERMDRAAGLDHSELGARVLHGPVAG